MSAVISYSERLARHSTPEPITGCLLWVGSGDRKGYGKLRATGKGRWLFAHRLAWELVNGPIPEGICVCHRCDTTACLNVEHLFLGSLSDNQRDKFEKGRQARRATHGQAKLTEDQVKAIKQLRCAGMKASDIGQRFGVSRDHVDRIVRGTRWKAA